MKVKVFDGCCPDCKHPGDDCPLSKIQMILQMVFIAFLVLMLNYYYGIPKFYSETIALIAGYFIL